MSDYGTTSETDAEFETWCQVRMIFVGCKDVPGDVGHGEIQTNTAEFMVGSGLTWESTGAVEDSGLSDIISRTTNTYSNMPTSV